MRRRRKIGGTPKGGAGEHDTSGGGRSEVSEELDLQDGSIFDVTAVARMERELRIRVLEITFYFTTTEFPSFEFWG